MLNLTYATADAELAKRLLADLTNIDSLDIQRGADVNTLIVLVSSAALHDADVQQAIAQARQRSDHIVPVVTEKISPPDDLQAHNPIDFSDSYNLDALVIRLRTIIRGQRRTTNNRLGYALVGIVVIMFIAAIYLVAVVGVEFPTDEYDVVNTEAAATINVFIGEFVDENMPRSDEEAANFPSTVEAAPTRYQPFVIGTATAVAGE